MNMATIPLTAGSKNNSGSWISNNIVNSDYNYSSYYYYSYEYDDYMYPGFTFERPVYLVIWEFLVISTFVLNLIVLAVFISRRLWSPTVVILSAIAVSDSLTGLVTLPAYIMVYQRYESPPDFEHYLNDQTEFMYQNEQQTSTQFQNLSNSGNQTSLKVDMDQYVDISDVAPMEGYSLTKDLCRSFMISKFFLSPSFRTISIFLTLFLAVQRYLSMVHPFKAETLFGLKKAKLYCLAIFILTPLLHVYHLVVEKAKGGLCQWKLSETGCKAGCIYLWAAFIVRHLIPCCTLVVFTVLFVLQLHKAKRQFEIMASSTEQISTRIKENRRVSLIVTIIVIVRLVPEIPYSIFLLYNGVDMAVNNGVNVTLKTNRIFHMSYELLLILSFQANFYIYVVFNGKFRGCLGEKCIRLRKRLIRDARNENETSLTRSSFTAVTTLPNRGHVDTGEQTEIGADNTDTHASDDLAVTETLLDNVSEK